MMRIKCNELPKRKEYVHNKESSFGVVVEESIANRVVKGGIVREGRHIGLVENGNEEEAVELNDARHEVHLGAVDEGQVKLVLRL